MDQPTVEKPKASLKAMPRRDPTCSFEPIQQYHTEGCRTFVPQKHRAGRDHPSCCCKTAPTAPMSLLQTGPWCLLCIPWHNTRCINQCPSARAAPGVPSRHVGSSSSAHSCRAHSLSRKKESGFNLESFEMPDLLLVKASWNKVNGGTGPLGIPMGVLGPHMAPAALLPTSSPTAPPPR